MSDAKIVVTFHRTYEVPFSQVKEKYETDYPELKSLNPDNTEMIESYAEEIARDWLADEMPEFVDNTEDFVSATTEIVYPKKE